MPYEITSTCCGHTQIYKPRGGKIKKDAHTNCKKCGKDFSIDIETSENIPKIPNLHKSKPSKSLGNKNIESQSFNPFTNGFIDDPDELLMSVATRELNKHNPDPRWASILINVRKENIGQSKKEGNIRSKFKSMNIKEIAKILSGKPKSISLKPDTKESS